MLQDRRLSELSGSKRIVKACAPNQNTTFSTESVDYCLTRVDLWRALYAYSIGLCSAIYGPSTAAQANAQTSDIHRTSVGYRLDTLRHETAYLTPDAPSNQPVALSRGMLAVSVHARAAMQNIPFSEPAVLFRKRQIPLNGNSARVLVVDDSRANAEALAASLAIDGLETQFALCGVDALKMLDFWQPHVFVLDISMPEHNGFAVARVLRGMPASRDAGIIVFTALGKAEFVATGPVVDFDEYCQKGGSHGPLLRMINGMLI